MGQIVSSLHHHSETDHNPKLHPIRDGQLSPMESPRVSSPRHRNSSLSSPSTQNPKRSPDSTASFDVEEFSSDGFSDSIHGDFLTELQENVADPMLGFPAEKPRNASKVGDVYLLVYKDPRCDLTDTPQQHQKHQHQHQHQHQQPSHEEKKTSEKEKDSKKEKIDTGYDHSFENVDYSTDLSDGSKECCDSEAGTHFTVLIDVGGESDDLHLIGLELHIGILDDNSYSTFSYFRQNEADLHGIITCHHSPKKRNSSSSTSTEEKTTTETEDNNSSSLKSEKEKERKRTLFLANRRVVDRDRLVDAVFLTKIQNKKKVDSFQWRADLERDGYKIYTDWVAKEGGESWSSKVNCQRFAEKLCLQAFDLDLLEFKNYKDSYHKHHNENKSPR